MKRAGREITTRLAAVAAVAVVAVPIGIGVVAGMYWITTPKQEGVSLYDIQRGAQIPGLAPNAPADTHSSEYYRPQTTTTLGGEQQPSFNPLSPKDWGCWVATTFWGRPESCPRNG